MNQSPSNEHAATPRHGCLPAWREADLPEPLPFSLGNLFRTIGPGAILLAGAIGGGEWIVGPTMVVKYGPGILWVATTAIVLQVIFNLEAVRYTMYTGEPILTGIMRLAPGPRFWIVYSTHLGNTDGLVRTVCDIVWSGFPSVQRWSASRLYACLLAALTAFGLVAVRMGSVLALFKKAVASKTPP